MKLLTALLALAFFAVLATSAIAGFLVYRIVKPQRTSSEINMASFPGRPDAIDFNVAGLGHRDGCIATAGFSRGCAARRRSSCATDTDRAAANC
jgi:hypothetical protein